jgi:TRAP-type mannitol/chloroaromatic compound transport system permease small subunit
LRALAVADAIDAVVSRIGAAAGWLMIALMVVTLFDVVSRRFFVLGSTMLQELEWHLHTMNFCLAIGFAYLRDAHVRIDVVRESLSPRRRAWIEVAGGLFLILPFCVVVFLVSVQFVEMSWAAGERSSSGMGLDHRWAIKSFVPLAMVLLALATVAVLIRNLLLLLGPPAVRARLAALHPLDKPVVGT